MASPPPLPKSSDSTKRYATLYEIYMRQVVTSERLGEGRKAVYIVAISITEAISQATYSNPGYRVTDIRAVAGGALSIDLIIMPDAK